MLRQAFVSSAGQWAVIDGAQRLTYGELSHACETLAANLAHTGVQRGDRIAVMLPNGLDAVLCVAAVALLGGVLVPLGTRLKRPEIGYVLSDSEPVAVIFAPEFAAEMPEHRGAPQCTLT
jgi:acyl-CoA synthetase (AMP-forming)/AMP-acid ligase II